MFGSLYRDDVLIKPSRVVSILAAACMLQLVSAPNKINRFHKYQISTLIFVLRHHMGQNLIRSRGLLSCAQDSLIQQCGETMKENISAKTVCGYYACASIYGLDSVMKKSDFNPSSTVNTVI